MPGPISKFFFLCLPFSVEDRSSRKLNGRTRRHTMGGACVRAIIWNERERQEITLGKKLKQILRTQKKNTRVLQSEKQRREEREGKWFEIISPLTTYWPSRISQGKAKNGEKSTSRQNSKQKMELLRRRCCRSVWEKIKVKFQCIRICQVQGEECCCLLRCRNSTAVKN